jgi:hypothetical protein
LFRPTSFPDALSKNKIADNKRKNKCRHNQDQDNIVKWNLDNISLCQRGLNHFRLRGHDVYHLNNILMYDVDVLQYVWSDMVHKYREPRQKGK